MSSAATFIRAGFDFAYEDESDTTVKHAEFIAKHRESGLTIAVEAKARRRVVKAPFDVASIRPNVRELCERCREETGAPVSRLLGIESAA